MAHRFAISRLIVVLIIGLATNPTSGFTGTQGVDYTLGPGDVISVTVRAGGEDQFTDELAISKSGTVSLPLIGEMQVEGLTRSELQRQILEPLERDYFYDPTVIVAIKKYRSFRFHISGAVQSPGFYELTVKPSLLELIAKAGGVLEGRGNYIFVLRASQKAVSQGDSIESLLKKSDPIKVDLEKLLVKGDMTLNLILEKDDAVYIPNMPSRLKIYMDGEIESPGIYKYKPGLTALDACYEAGGFTEFAAPNRTKIIRKNGDKPDTIKIDLTKVMKGKIPDIELRPGDRIIIPESWI